MCVHTSHFLTQVHTESKIKIILQQQAGSQRFIYIHCYHQGDEWGRSIYTQSHMPSAERTHEEYIVLVRSLHWGMVWGEEN